MTVVVDRGALGGGIDEVCNAAGGGNNAAALFTGSGYTLTYVQRTPGFVCRIDGQPSSDPCVNTPPTDAYWGLWWSDGTSGSWSYASVGAGSLTVPDGGYVAFAWQSGSRSAPGVPATAHAGSSSSSPTPSSSPSTGGSGGGGGGTGGGGGGGNGHGGNGGGGGGGGTAGHGSASPTPGAGPTSSAASASAASSATPSASGSASQGGKGSNGGNGGKGATGAPSATPTPSSSALPTPASDSATQSASAEGGAEVQTTGDGAALPGWVVPVVILALATGSAVAFVIRRRGRPAP